MKKLTAVILSIVLVISLAALSACGSKTAAPSGTDNAASGDDKTITVGASATPHAEILEQVKDTLAAQGYTLKIVTYDDYVLPNKALADGELDANYFQHAPYLESYNKSNGTSLVSAGAIHYEPFGIYGNGITDPHLVYGEYHRHYEVLENLETQGYHLQMPPAEDEYIEHLPEELLRRNDPM